MKIRHTLFLMAEAKYETMLENLGRAKGKYEAAVTMQPEAV
jgi:hypothetical protein